MNQELLRHYATLDARRKALEKQAETIKALQFEISGKLYKSFVNEGIADQTISPAFINEQGEEEVLFKDGRSRKIKPDLKPKAGYTVEEEPIIFKWLRANGHEAMIKETVNANSLNAWIKKQRAANQTVPECMKVFDVETVKLTLGRKPTTKEERV